MNSSVETIQAKHLNLALQVTLQVEYYDWPLVFFFLHLTWSFYLPKRRPIQGAL